MRPSRGVGAVVLAVALVAAGCGAAGGAREVNGEAGRHCDDQSEINGLHIVSCVEAVATAEQALGVLHVPIKSAEFSRGALCPEDRACPAHVGIQTGGVVTFTFWWGDPVTFEVTIETYSGAAVAVRRDVPR